MSQDPSASAADETPTASDGNDASESAQETAAQETAAQETAAKSASPVRRRGRWRKLLYWGLGIFLVLTLVRYVLEWSLPAIINSSLEDTGLECEWERLDLWLFAGDLELWHLELKERGQDEAVPPVFLEYFRADIDVLALLTGRLVVRRAEIDGLDVTLERDADGSFPFFERFASAGGVDPAPEADEEDDAPQTDEEPEPFDLSMPFAVKAARVQAVRMTLHDRTQDPPRTTRADLDARVSDFGDATRPARLVIDLHSPACLDSLAIEAQLTSSAERLELLGSVRARGIRPQGLGAYLEAAGLRPIAELVSFDAQIETRAETIEERQAVRASARLDAIELAADSNAAFALDSLAIEIDRYDREGAHVASLTTEGLVVRATKTRDGHVRFAGLELVPDDEPAGAVIAASEGAASAPAEAVAVPSGESFSWVLAELRAGNLRFELRDESVQPAVDIVVGLEELIAKGLRAPETEGEPGRFEGSLLGPGIWALARFDGTIEQRKDGLDVSWSLAMEGLHPQAILPWLRAAGLDTELDAGRLAFAGKLSTRGDSEGLRVDTRVDTLTLANGGRELFGVEKLEAQLVFAADGTTEIPRLAFERLRGEFDQDVDGTVRTLGLVLRPDRPARLTEAVHLSIAEASFELTGMTIGATRDASSPGRLLFSLVAPGVFERLAIEGDVLAASDAANARLALRVEGLAGGALKPWLEAAGARSLFESGTLSLDLESSARFVEDTTHVELALSAISLRDGDTEWFGIDRIGLGGFRSSPTQLALAELLVERPRARVLRDVDGAIEVAGLRFLPPSPPSIEAKAGAGTSRTSELPATTGSGTASPAPVGEIDAATVTAAPASIVRLGRFEVRDATVAFTDAFVEPKVEVEPSLQISLSDLVVGDANAAPGRFTLDLAIPESLERFGVEGTLALGETQQLDWKLSADGLRAGRLASYLPPDLHAELENGHLEARLHAKIARVENAPSASTPANGPPPADTRPIGGLAVDFKLEEFAYRDGDAEPLATLASIRLHASRIDREEIVLDRLELLGLTTRVERRSEGRLGLLGLEIRPPVAAVPETANGTNGATDATGAKDRAETLGATQPAAARAGRDGTVSGAAQLSDATSVTERLATPPAKNGDATKPEAVSPRLRVLESLPLVRVEKFALELERLRVTDRAHEGTTPLEVLGWRLENSETIRLLGENPEDEPAVKLSLRGKVVPLIEQVAVDVEAGLFAAEPYLDLEVDVRGIEGAELTNVFPDLAESMDGSEMRDGRFRFGAHASINARRRGPFDFSFSNGLAAELDLRELRHSRGEDELLLGLAGARVAVSRYEPSTGFVHISAIEVETPAARVQIDEAGTHVAGLVLKRPAKPAAPPASAEEPATATVEIGDVSDPPVAEASTKKTAPVQPFKLDRFTISGVDFVLTDTTGSRPTVIPLTSLEAELSRLSEKTMTAGEPCRFNVYLQSGEVELPKRENANLLRGMLTDAVRLAAGGEKVGEASLENRKLFEEISIAGKLALGPKPSGWVKSSISGLELGSFKGMLEDSGIILEDGTLDSGIVARVQTGEIVDVETTTTVTDLSMSEPADGPIYRWLKLPAPLDAVLFALRDSGGAVSLPVSFPIDLNSSAPATSTIAGSVALALTQVIGTALAAAPLRAANSATDLVGLGNATDLVGGLLGGEEVEIEPITVEFVPGDATLERDQTQRLEALREMLLEDDKLQLKLTHAFGAEDLARIVELANPSRKNCEDLLTRLRQRRAELQRESEEITLDLRAAILAGEAERERALRSQVVSLGRELSGVEHALDGVYELLRPNAARRAPRRARAASVRLAELRLDSVYRALLELDIPDIERRVEKPVARFKAPEKEDGGRVIVTPLVSQTEAPVAE